MYNIDTPQKFHSRPQLFHDWIHFEGDMDSHFTKFGLKPNNDVVNIYFNEQAIEVKQYLPVEEKLNMISDIINSSIDTNNFYNPSRLHMYQIVNIVMAYTNISFTDKQKEDLVKLYDILESNNIFNIVIEAMPKAEYKSIIDGVQECADAVYTYKTSLLGIVETISTDYSNVEFDASKIQHLLADEKNLGLLRDILTNIG
jgi:hypothetical protein